MIACGAVTLKEMEGIMAMIQVETNGLELDSIVR
jgi:hypothetical protein